MAKNLLETDLYAPIESFLKKNGYLVHAEVLLSDISAVKGDELLVVEMKTRFNIEVLLQAVRRQEAADSVYVAVPVPENRRYPGRWTDLKRLCRRLGLGILLIRFPEASEPEVEPALLAGDDKPRRRAKKTRSSFLREIHERPANYNVGGSTRKALVTAYRFEALKIAAKLAAAKELSPRDLKALGSGKKTGSILLKNYYGWFERLGPGRYALSEEGRKALVTYAEILEKL